MLYTTRKKGEAVTISGENVVIIIADVRNEAVRLGIDADPDKTTITVGSIYDTRKEGGNE